MSKYIVSKTSVWISKQISLLDLDQKCTIIIVFSMFSNPNSNDRLFVVDFFSWLSVSFISNSRLTHTVGINQAET